MSSVCSVNILEHGGIKLEETRALVRKRKKYFVGYISEDWIFTEIEEIQELADVDYWSSYRPLKDFMITVGVNSTQKFVREVLKENGCQEMWIYDAPVQLSDSGTITQKAWKNYWWKSRHPMCLECIKECKQSSRVDLYCPQYEEKE